MFPTLNNASFVSQPADSLSGNDLINYYLTHGSKEKIMEILRTKCLTERQLIIIKSRGQLNLSNQDCIWISQRITIIRQYRLDQEVAIPPWNAGYSEGSRRTVSAISTHDTRAITARSQLSSQASPHVNQGHGNAFSTMCTEDSETTTTAFDFLSLNNHALAVTSQSSASHQVSPQTNQSHGNAFSITCTDDSETITTASTECTFDFLSFNNHALAVTGQSSASHQVSPQTNQSCSNAFSPIGVYNSERAENHNTAQVARATPQASNVRQRVLGHSERSQRPYGSNLEPWVLNLINDCCYATDDEINTVIDGGDPEDMTKLIRFYPMTRSQLNMIQNKNPQISNHVRKTLNSRLDTSLEDGQRDLSTPYWSILRHKNTPDVFKSIVERIMRSDQDRNNEPLPLNNNAISIVGENAQAIAMQQAINESMNSHADAVAFQAPPGWGNINAKAIQLQNLEKELNANRQPQTIIELIDENKALKEANQCRFPGCSNVTCIHYFHGDDSNGHMIHCKEHTLKVNDKCPRCEKKITGVMQMFR